MAVSQPRTYSLRSNEGGFTLPEVLITIILMGIVFAIATSTWQGTVNSRQVDSATKQLVADMRLANTNATNRLTNYQVVLTNGSSTYQFGPVVDPPVSPTPRTLPDDVKVSTGLTTIEFKPDGSVIAPAGATAPTDAANEIVISKTSPPGNPKHSITVNPNTSRVKVD